MSCACTVLPLGGLFLNNKSKPPHLLHFIFEIKIFKEGEFTCTVSHHFYEEKNLNKNMIKLFMSINVKLYYLKISLLLLQSDLLKSLASELSEVN